MATITTGGSGNWSSVTNNAPWPSGVAPVEGDKLVVASGHTVTVDGTYIVGDDSTTAVTITGTLKASRSANSSLTVKGDIQMSALTSATLDYGRFSTTDPIPAAYTATLILNYSASMVNYKYGLFVGEAANFYACGATRTRNTVTTSSLSASGTSVDVADITGWAVGDWIALAQTEGVPSRYDRRQISTITPTVGTAGTVTFSAVTYSHATGCPVSNFSSNVTIKSYNTTNPAYLCLRVTSATSNNRRELDYVTFEYVGSDVSLVSTKVFVSSTLSSVITPLRTFTNCSFYNGANSVGLFINLLNTTTIFNNHCFLIDVASAGALMYTASGTYVQFEDCVVIYTTGVSTSSAYSQGGQGATYRRCKFWGTITTNGCVSVTNGAGIKFIDCQFHSNLATTAFTLVASGDATFTTCKFGSSDLPGTPTLFYVADSSTTFGQVGTFRFNDCLFGTPSTSFYKNLDKPNLAYVTYVSNKNLDPLVQEIYTPNGMIVRDNNSKISGVTSVKLTPTSATNALTFTLDIPSISGKAVAVSGTLNRDTANTTTVTLSGLGITPSVYTASGAVDTNEQFFVSGTQTTGTKGILTLTISVTGTSGNLWVDNVSAPQVEAIDFGEFNFWANGAPVTLVTASYVSALDVWNTLASNVNVAGSMGKKVKSIFINTI